MNGERRGGIRPQFGRQPPDPHGTRPGLTALSPPGWTPDREPELPAGTAAARVARVDRGLLTVLATDGERRVHPASAIYDGSGVGVPRRRGVGVAGGGGWGGAAGRARLPRPAPPVGVHPVHGRPHVRGP